MIVTDCYKKNRKGKKEKMKNQTLIISFLFLLLIFSCTSEEGKKFLQKFQKDEKLKFEIEQKIADTNGISIIADIENS